MDALISGINRNPWPLYLFIASMIGLAFYVGYVLTEAAIILFRS